ncbi:hypothetical protein L3X38_037722 [Prunus dulcis]|uniref:Uncharacterized protein n=1 Tax=Prunus dulcis TaxID=3755 RepID=A0AAD4V3Y2_PRUDU|nr:hypothetical protein L3X38_037722 [Prunus dulcis]
MDISPPRGGCTKGQEGSIDPLACRRLLRRSQENSCRPLGQQLVDPLDALNAYFALKTALLVAGRIGLDYLKINSCPPQKSNGLINIKWQAPPLDWIKVNFDGSVCGNLAATDFVIYDWNVLENSRCISKSQDIDRILETLLFAEY